jgi:phosphatidylserine decarboxylase
MRILLQEDVNFLLTNRLARRLATKAVGRIAAIEHPLVSRPALAAWRLFVKPDLSNAATTRFTSLKHGFTRGLRPGARAYDPDPALVDAFREGMFVTLRLTAAMYHRFHAPADVMVAAVTYLSWDCWNVNPIALKRVERLFCRNERAVIEARLADGTPLLLVPVAAILVAGIRLGFVDT